MPIDLNTALRNLDVYGLTDVLLPFMLIFTVVYAVMTKTKILGGEKKFSVIVALVVSLLVVLPHINGTYPGQMDPVVVINQSLPAVAVWFVAILMLMILLGVWGKEFDIAGSSFAGIVALISLLIILYIFGSNAGWWESPYRIPVIGDVLSDPNTQSLLIVLLIFGLIIWFVTKEEKPSGSNFLKELGDLFKNK
ncbi:MAG: hypothetical protein QW331_00205 [Candidatus Woesearchaeota archaeon]